MDKSDQILQSLHQFKSEVMDRFNDGEKRFDKQDLAIADIQDQIKGNTDKEIVGIRPQIKEMKKVLVIPIFITRLPGWAKWALGAIVVNGLADINSMGLIAFFKFLLHLTKP